MYVCTKYLLTKHLQIFPHCSTYKRLHNNFCLRLQSVRYTFFLHSVIKMKLIILVLIVCFVYVERTTAKCTPCNCSAVECPEILCIVGAIRINFGGGPCGCCPRCVVPGGKKIKYYFQFLCL